MKLTAKITSAVLALCLFAALIPTLSACDRAEDEPRVYAPLTIGVLSDPQIVAAAEVGDDDYPDFQEFNAVGQKMLFISEAILMTAVDRMIEAKVDVVLIPGDLTENGSKVGHETVARECRRMEDAGIKVYVVCGNHDINKDPDSYATGVAVPCDTVTQADFMRIFADYGFAEAIARDEIKSYANGEQGSMSYVCDLNADYRLICVDAANYYSDESGNRYLRNENGDLVSRGAPIMTERLMNWIEEQLIACRNDGKVPFIMEHFPVNDPMGEFVGSLGMDDVVINMRDQYRALLTRYGVKTVFTGHLHTQHVASYADENGSFVDIETGCLTNYALPLRFLTYDENGAMTVRNEYLDKVNPDYVPAYVSADIKSKITTDLQSYALRFVYDNLINNIDGKINDEEEYSMFLNILGKIGFDEESDEALDLADMIYTELYQKFIYMPVNGRDVMSIESICLGYGIQIPANDYEDVFEFIIDLVGKVYKGEGNIVYGGTEEKLLKYCIYSALYVINESGFLSELHEQNEDIAEIDLTALLDRLFREDVLDLTAGDFIAKAVTIVNPILSDVDLPLNIKLSEDIGSTALCGLVSTLLPTMLSKISVVDYDAEAGTLWGVAMSDLMDLDKGEIYFDGIIEKVVFGVVGKNLLWYAD